MKDSEGRPLQSQVRERRRPTEFELEPVVTALLDEGVCDERIQAMLAVTAVVTRLFPHWTVADEPGRGLYAVAVEPKAIARMKQRG